jgi:cytosine/adenosine deaminase-related metal-dependent hydrolase
VIDRLSGVVLLPTNGNPAGSPVDLLIRDGRIAAITPAAGPPARRLLGTPALVNAHDHARPLSATSFGAGGKPLETWLLRLAAMPAIDPYLGALAAFGRAARAGAGSVMAHYTRFHGPMSPVDEARAIARAAADVGVRVTLDVFMRDRNPLVYGDEANALKTVPAEARATVEASSSARLLARKSRWLVLRLSPRRPRALHFPFSSDPAVRNGAPTRCLPQLRMRRTGRGGASICIFWKRAISAPPTGTESCSA